MAGSPLFTQLVERGLQSFVSSEEVIEKMLSKWAKSVIKIKVAWDKRSKLDVMSAEFSVVGYQGWGEHIRGGSMCQKHDTLDFLWN